MFGLGMTEILMILAIALIIIGPKKLPELAKTLGHAMGEFKRSAQDFKRSIDVEAAVKDFDNTEITTPSLKDVIKNSEKQAPSKNDTAYPPENDIPENEKQTTSTEKDASPSQASADNIDSKS
ncbi:MAG: twin-arginine translocase TatA/TatE family subunit [Proteobacteria bacterium]|nr:twin-arginine translocase TatA/TatE family subunit [Pseudomonadota bacterium]MBU1386390.1 twin-arginine translocase TatA/TatE family subunit [Pseudomonadota bacterium]MBU1544501.1 twin-arginine translocase TatA/TatE family subunit [Pseudomonadota bacterium]MBU2429176.1 twin-arginine translocase TatA/TatE family subunit [Pseudomonadota bacterium]MBU2480425.1 twin-arginine translocase TatA/TatE family subunit [Pseudomonadota bacterium]